MGRKAGGSSEMESIMMQDDSVLSWNTAMLLYNSALKEMGTKIEILNDEFQHVHQYNPIEYVKTRLKSPGEYCQEIEALWIRGFHSEYDRIL